MPIPAKKAENTPKNVQKNNNLNNIKWQNVN